MDGMFVSSHNSFVEMLTSSAMVLTGGAFEKRWAMRVDLCSDEKRLEGGGLSRAAT